MTLTAVKIKVRKLLPSAIFDIGIWFWRNTFQRVLGFIDWLNLRSFKSEITAELTHRETSFKLLINPKNGFIDEYIFLHGVYEDYILDYIAKFLPHDGVFFDIGSNIGQHAIFAASLLKNSGQVYAFEPVPDLFNQLEKSIHINNLNNIKAYNLACGNDDQVRTIDINNRNAGQSSLIPMEVKDNSLSVKTVRLDDIMTTLSRLDLMKIDVEGFEYEVLLGAKAIIDKFKPVILLEYSPFLYDKTGQGHSEKILDFLLEHYNITDIDDGGYQVTDRKSYLKDLHQRNRLQTNILCSSNSD